MGEYFSRKYPHPLDFVHQCVSSQVGKYCKTSNISRTLVGNKIVDNSDVVGAIYTRGFTVCLVRIGSLWYHTASGNPLLRPMGHCRVAKTLENCEWQSCLENMGLAFETGFQFAHIQLIGVHDAPLCVLFVIEILCSGTKLTLVLKLSAWCVFHVLGCALSVYHLSSHWARVCLLRVYGCYPAHGELKIV